MTDHETRYNSGQKDKNINPMVLSYLTMRRALGFLGLFLPLILLIGGWGTEGCLRDSISSFYYSESIFLHDLFVVVLCTMGVFLVCYKGYEKEEDECISDNLVASVAGFSIIFVAMFPMVSWSLDAGTLVRFILHYGSAGLFFSAVAFMSFYKFTRSNPDTTGGNTKESARKKCRNKVYRACAIAIAIFILILIPLKWLLEKLLAYDLDSLNWVFWFESLAVWAFAISWLVKGEVLMRDSKKKRSED